jgi:hypothetical protein
MGTGAGSPTTAWLDQPLPALRGDTPRQAAQSQTLHPKLRDFLRELDNHTERARAEGRFGYDSGWLWSALRLRRPLLRP